MYSAADSLCPIDEERFDAILGALTAKADHARDALRILQALRASGLVGRVFDRRCEEIARAALPGYRVRYYLRDYPEHRPRGLCIALDDEQGIRSGERWRWDFELATAKAPRLTAETLDARVTYYRDQLKTYSAAAAALPTLTAEYNASCDYMRGLQSRMRQILYLSA